MAGSIREKQLVILLILFTRVPSHTGAGNVEKSILLFGLFSKNVLVNMILNCQPDTWPEVLATLSGFFMGQTRLTDLAGCRYQAL